MFLRVLAQEQLDHRHTYIRLLHRHVERERIRTGRRIGIAHHLALPAHAYLRAIMEELRVFDLIGHPFKMDMLERPAEDMKVEPVPALREATIRRRRELAGSGTVDRPAIKMHPLAD